MNRTHGAAALGTVAGDEKERRRQDPTDLLRLVRAGCADHDADVRPTFGTLGFISDLAEPVSHAMMQRLGRSLL